MGLRVVEALAYFRDGCQAAAKNFLLERKAQRTKEMVEVFEFNVATLIIYSMS